MWITRLVVTILIAVFPLLCPFVAALPFESCDVGQHQVCYHGGVCQSHQIDNYGNTQLFCDCAKAVDAVTGNPYVGKQCELATVATCDPNNPGQFCFNGGICNDKYPAYGNPCLCVGSNTGTHCEYTNGDYYTIVAADQVSTDNSTTTSSTSGTNNATSGTSGGSNATATTATTSSSCSLDCGSGGTCVKGQPSATDRANDYHYWKDTTTTNDMYCNCTDSWDGPTCEIARVPCGPDYCFYGSTCFDESDGNETVHHCDCSAASDQTASYAGRFCQYKATEYCSKDPVLNAELFCVNGGTCRDNVYEGCNCPDGFTGFSCEFRMASSSSSSSSSGADVIEVVDEGSDYGRPVVDPEQVSNCTMACINGGTCRHGKKVLGAGLDLFVSANATNSNSADGAGTSDDFEHCVCPDNYAGTFCELQVQTCGEGQTLCLHGGKCVEVGSEQLCDCNEVDSPLATFFAGSRCEHPVNDICTEGGVLGRSSSSVIFGNAIPGSSLSFCVNGGTCKQTVSATEPHPGCNCPEGFLGPHCELRESAEVPNLRAQDPYANPQSNAAKDGRSGFEIAVLVLSVAALVVVAMFSVNTYVRRRKQRNAAITSSLNWSPNYRDRAPEINIAPKRGSTHSENFVYEQATQEAFARSSRDPIAAHFVGSAAAKRAAAAAQLITTTEHSSSDEEFSDDLPPEPKIFIGPPRDEDGHELHNVEIV